MPGAPESLGRFSVLIVDDSLGFPSLVRTWLQQDGRFVVVGLAAGGEEGKAMASELGPDVVVLDLVLPDVRDPAVLVSELRALHPPLRIVLVSSLRKEQLDAAGQAMGVEAVCNKASSAAEFVGTVYAVASAAGKDTQNRLP